MCEILHTSVICGTALLTESFDSFRNNFWRNMLCSHFPKWWHNFTCCAESTLERWNFVAGLESGWLYKIHKGDRCRSGPVSLGGQQQQQFEQQEDRCYGQEHLRGYHAVGRNYVPDTMLPCYGVTILRCNIWCYNILPMVVYYARLLQWKGQQEAVNRKRTSGLSWLWVQCNAVLIFWDKSGWLGWAEVSSHVLAPVGQSGGGTFDTVGLQSWVDVGDSSVGDKVGSCTVRQRPPAGQRLQWHLGGEGGRGGTRHNL